MKCADGVCLNLCPLVVENNDHLHSPFERISAQWSTSQVMHAGALVEQFTKDQLLQGMEVLNSAFV